MCRIDLMQLLKLPLLPLQRLHLLRAPRPPSVGHYRGLIQISAPELRALSAGWELMPIFPAIVWLPSTGPTARNTPIS